VSGLRLEAAVADRDVEIEFSVAPGEVLAILGPNGSGKSTALHVIAGLLRPDRGLVRAGDRVLTDTAAGVHVPAHQRRIGLLMQDPLLFPHLSVRANVGFNAAPAIAARWLDDVGATDLADRRPRELSGGQAQRVALARALATRPDALLLDEPMAGLDVTVAAALRGVLRRVLRTDGRCAVLVTHDVLDVLTLADRVVVVENGRVAEQGPTRAVLAAPRSAFAARVAGLNLISGTMCGPGTLQTTTGQHWSGCEAEPLTVGSPVVAVFPPAAVSVFADRPAGSPRNVVDVEIADLDAQGAAIRLRARSGQPANPGIAADITAEAAADLGVAPGTRVWFAVKAQEVTLHPAERAR
jgi:molybdate transport system ATP-binding protein